METTVEVTEASQVAEVRRVAAETARAEQMTDEEIGRVSLVATELSTNLVKYGVRGKVTLKRYSEASLQGVEIIAVDQGPGFSDLAAAMRDGHSTAGSLGIGLGSVKRASTSFDVYTLSGQGSAVLARVQHAGSRRRHAAASLVVSARTTPKKGQVESGDAWRMRDFGQRQLICIVDGLGHGPLAALAARRAVAAFEAVGASEDPAAIVQDAHALLKDTRGVVMAVLALDRAAGAATFCGVGNIAAVIVHGGKSQHLLSVEGIVGYNLRKVRNQTAVWGSGAVAILNTDGLSNRWNTGKYPGLLLRHTSLIASVLFRDHARDTDDATIVVAREA
jgi:anti-sigma regulatory factor (Ser/Thr protein kinase)